MSTFELMQENLATEQEARENRKERAKQFADEAKALASDEDPDIRGPIVDALCFDVLPKVLEEEFGVSSTLEDLCKSDLTLRQVQERQKQLDEKEAQVDSKLKKDEAERLKIGREWEKLKANPEKMALQKRIEQLESEKKDLESKVRKAFIEGQKIVFVTHALLGTITECSGCRNRFVKLMKPYPDRVAWLLRGEWGASYLMQ